MRGRNKRERDGERGRREKDRSREITGKQCVCVAGGSRENENETLK